MGGRPSVVMFHGDFAEPGHLKDDMGDPSWVDWYGDHQGRGRRDLPDEWILEQLPSGPLILGGFSDGGDTAARLSTIIPDRIVGAIIYESPVRSVDRPGGDFPCLMIWNDRSKRAQSRQAQLSEARWREGGRDVTILRGRGKHTKRVPRFSTWFLGHGWDVSLNAQIGEWILSVDSSAAVS